MERQRTSNTCRLHAINNAVGSSIVSRKKFFDYCDEFDMIHGCKGSRQFFFIHTNDNIFSFILNKFNIQNSYYPPDNPPHLSEDSCNDIMAVIIFDDSHAWCAKKCNNTWFNLDSLSNDPEPTQFRKIFSRQGFGWIVLWNNIKPVSNDQSFESDSKVEEHTKTNSTNHSLKVISKRSLKCNKMEEEFSFDESSSIFETNELNQSNRFEILSSIE